MPPIIPGNDIQKPPRVSDEILLGVTVGGYLILAVALYCFGQGLFPRGWSDDVGPFRPYSEDPSALLLLVPGIFVGALCYLQVVAKMLFKHPPNQKTTRIALWLNALSSLGFCLIVALKRAPNTGYVPADGYFELAIAAVTLVIFLLGILISIINILSGFIRSRNAATEKFN
jgi:hypothetical protein